MRTAEERYALVARVLAGEAQKSVEISEEITSGGIVKTDKIWDKRGRTFFFTKY